MEKKQKIIIAIVAVLVAGVIIYTTVVRDAIRKQRASQIMTENKEDSVEKTGPLNDGEVSPISGLPCENWNRRPIAVMQPSDPLARPASGFSQADMVIEMPVITAGTTRLMGIYICNLPEKVGSVRSSRHDFIHLAKGLDAILVPWGRSESHSGEDPIGLAQGILNRDEIDNINCNADAGTSVNACPNSSEVCFRVDGYQRGVDNAHTNTKKAFECAKDLGYRIESEFSGYPHQAEASFDERPEGGNLRVAFARPNDVEYEYDKETNSYLRIWGDVADIDRNNDQRLTPKNIVVMFARSEQIEGQYNNVQLGDPWYDETDSGEAYYYMNGKEYRGTWKKDKNNIDSKLKFYDENGEEIMFVPGQVWVEILEPGQVLRWTPSS